MRRGISIGMAMVGVAAAACTPGRTPEAAPPAADAPPVVAPAEKPDTMGTLVVRRLAGRIWLHESQSEDGRFTSNGLLVEEENGVLLIDTAWGDEQTGALAEWSLRRLGKPIRRAISTHWHADRLGGIDTLTALGARVSALDLTAREAEAHGISPLPAVYLTARQRARTDAAGFEVFYPGPGHSRDNVVVWFPAERVLFGGCFVKGAEARDLGNLSDADVRSWPASVGRTAERYPSAAIVVPGHGAPGGLGLLTHTLALLSAPAARNGGG